MTTDRVVVFDIGRVLVDFDVARAVRNLAAATGKDAARVEAALFYGDDYGDYSRGRLDARGFHAAFTRRADAGALSFDAFDRAWCEMFSPMLDMDALASEVAARCPIFLCSNTDPLHYEYLVRTVPSLRLARAAVLSYEVGADKPEPAIYEALRVRLRDVPPERALFVDDRADNVEGALKAGFDAMQFATARALRGELRARGIEVAPSPSRR